MTEPVIRFFVCHHRPAAYFRSRYFIPVQAGRAVAPECLNYADGDDEGDNISNQNAFWSELTVLYSMWKNVEADWYGLMHYRRMLTFRKDCRLNGTFTYLDEKTRRRFGWTDEQVREYLESVDIVTAAALPVHPPGLPEHLMTVGEYYSRAHHKADLDSVVARVKLHWPEFYLPLLDCLSRTSMVTGNIVVMRHALFQDYCQFLFGVLLPESRGRDLQRYTAYQQRLWGFLAERLTQAWLIAVAQRIPDIRIAQTGVALGVPPQGRFPARLASPDRTQLTSEIIHIALAVDDAYALHADTMINSLLAALNPQQQVTFHVLCDSSLSEKSRTRLGNDWPNTVQFDFYDVPRDRFSHLPDNRRHISLRTWYRLMLAELLTDVSRVIWLDVDIVVCANVIRLWEWTLPGGTCIAACADEGGRDQAQRLGLDVSYFNAGVMLIDLDLLRLRWESPFTNYMAVFYQHQRIIRLQDQDVLNIAHQGEVCFLPLIFNVQSRCYLPDRMTPSYSQEEAAHALQAPHLLHFTGPDKPWHPGCRHPLRSEYFRHLRQPTPRLQQAHFFLVDTLFRGIRRVWLNLGGERGWYRLCGTVRLGTLRRVWLACRLIAKGE